MRAPPPPPPLFRKQNFPVKEPRNFSLKVKRQQSYDRQGKKHQRLPTTAHSHGREPGRNVYLIFHFIKFFFRESHSYVKCLISSQKQHNLFFFFLKLQFRAFEFVGETVNGSGTVLTSWSGSHRGARVEDRRRGSSGGTSSGSGAPSLRGRAVCHLNLLLLGVRQHLPPADGLLGCSAALWV